MSPLRIVFLVLSTAFIAACGDDDKLPIGATCGDDSQCASGICAANVCLDPAGDEDGDGIINGLEASLGSNPVDVDSDGDGKLDEVEFDAISPRDSDGDSRPDLIESAIADRDGDCVVDETDPDEDGAGELIAELCLTAGVCSAGVELTCDLGQGVATGCQYGKVVGYSTSETCDNRDNDCDGQTDEDCGEQPSASCEDVYRATLGASGPYTIEPDGVAVEVQCAMGFADRGWTRLDPTYEAVLARQPARLRQYLFLDTSDTSGSGRFVASPWSDSPFPWDTSGHLSGTWLTGLGPTLDDLGSFGCEANGTEAGVGFGCFAATGVSATRVISRDEATIELCGRGLDGVGAWTGCSPATVFVREARCAASKFNLISDSGFEALAAGEETCWRIESTQGSLNELSAGVFADFTDAPPEQAPAIRAEPFVPTPGLPWFVSLVQDEMIFAKGAHYRLVFWAKASAFRILWVDIGQTSDFVELLPVGDTWRQYEVDFVASATTTMGSIRFNLSDVMETQATLWLDGVAVFEGRHDACARAGQELIANGGFDSGLACWERVRSLEDATNSLGTDGDAPVTAPSALATPAPNDTSEGGAPYISQAGLALVAGRSYTLTFAARSTAERTMRMTLLDEQGAGLFIDEEVVLGTAWTTHRIVFEVPAEATVQSGRIMVFFGHPDIAPVWLDDVSLTPTTF